MNTTASTPRRGSIAGAILATLALGFAIDSCAEDNFPPQVTVTFSDLEISTSPGAAALYDRIRIAAVDVCWRMYESSEAYRLHKNACLRKVIADAVSKVNEPALSAVFASNYGASIPMVIAATQR